MEDLNQMSLLYAIVSDPEHRKRLDAIKTEQERLDAQRAELASMQEANQQTLRDARDQVAKAEAIRQDAADREAKLVRDTEALRAANQALTDEKTRWEKVRQAVDKEHGDKETRLQRMTSDAEAAERAAAERSDALRQREAAVQAAEQRHAAAVEHARNFVAAMNA